MILAPHPPVVKTLGDHIRFVRLERRFRQKDAADATQVDIWTLLLWEKNRTKPLVRHYPRIIDFLGYCPYQHPKTSGERFRLFRIHRGLTQKLAAKYLSVDPNTIAVWAENRGTGWPDHERKMGQFLEFAPSPEEVERHTGENPDYYRYAADPQTLGERFRRLILPH